MTLWSIGLLSGAMFLLAITPGPGVFATVSTVLISSFLDAILLIIGVVVGDIIFLLLALYGLNFIAQILGEFFIFIRYMGAVYLIYLGYKIWNLDICLTNIKNSRVSWRANFFTGLLITLSNPKVIIFYLTFLPAFIDLTKLTTADVFIVVMVVASTLFIVLLGYAYMATKAKGFIINKSALSYLNKVLAAAIVVAGFLVIFKN